MFVHVYHGTRVHVYTVHVYERKSDKPKNPDVHKSTTNRKSSRLAC